jgi:hypothetical protein
MTLHPDCGRRMALYHRAGKAAEALETKTHGIRMGLIHLWANAENGMPEDVKRLQEVRDYLSSSILTAQALLDSLKK